MPDSVMRSRSCGRGNISSSLKTDTYLSSMAHVRTDSSCFDWRQHSTSCAGGKRELARNLCTYLRATSCLPLRTMSCTTSSGAMAPSTLSACAPTYLSAPSYRLSSSIRRSSACVGYSLVSPNSRAKRNAAVYSLKSTRRCSSCVGSNACSRCQRCTRSQAMRRSLALSSSRTCAMRDDMEAKVPSAACWSLRFRSTEAEGMTTILGTA
mmetsp:Transcript_12401/g.26833  ORF Transcript_12401/g.26833 Transcript_12401/m.26833 type:complete len:209 (+) Transcript_12401:931-1557(+)